MAGASSSLLKVAHLPSRGRALVASQALLPGQVLLQESPLLLYQDAHTASSNTLCFHCARPNPNPNLNPSDNGSWSSCPTCQVAAFCGPECASASLASSHTPFVCKALSLLVLCTLDFDLQTQARYLVAAYNLAVISPHAFEQLLMLEGEGVVDEKVHLVHTFLSEVIRSWQLECQELSLWSVQFVASLLAKDQRNAFGLSTFTRDPSLRQGRAYAIYAQASFFNHDCLPNACRFDYLTKPGMGNTDIIIRSLHDISEGAEVCISYFPINWPFAERQKKLREEYGFECKCERCKVEENWSDEDIGEQADDISVEGEGSEEDEDMESRGEEVMDAEEDSQGSFPHAMFFVKYLCPNESCGGTMAPLPPTEGGASSVMECNVCGQLRSEDDFLQEIQAHKVSS
eukprot:c23895_g3_i1 orf=466-1668(-)